MTWWNRFVVGTVLAALIVKAIDLFDPPPRLAALPGKEAWPWAYLAVAAVLTVAWAVDIRRWGWTATIALAVVFLARAWAVTHTYGITDTLAITADIVVIVVLVADRTTGSPRKALRP